MSQETDHHGPFADTDTFDGSNETIRILLERGSCRNFKPDPVPESVLNTILTVGVRAPTGGNLQPFSIINIQSQDAADQITEWCGGQKYIAAAPVNLLFCIDWRRLKRWAALKKAPFAAHYGYRHFWISFQDTIIAAQNICTAADALGLGSVYIGTVMECIPQLRNLLKLPELVFPVVLLSMGYPKEKPPVRRKLRVQDIVHDETYRDLSDEALLHAYELKYPDAKIQITDDRRELFTEVCRDAHGISYAESTMADVEKTGHFNMAQRYFGLHYVTHYMAQGAEEFLAIARECGFHWFDPFTPPVETP